MATAPTTTNKWHIEEKTKDNKSQLEWERKKNEAKKKIRSLSVFLIYHRMLCGSQTKNAFANVFNVFVSKNNENEMINIPILLNSHFLFLKSSPVVTPMENLNNLWNWLKQINTQHTVKTKMRSEGETNTQTGGVESLRNMHTKNEFPYRFKRQIQEKFHAVEKEMVLRYLRHYWRYNSQSNIKFVWRTLFASVCVCCKNIFSEKHEAICGFNDNNKIKKKKKKQNTECIVVLHKIEAALRQISSSSHF